MTHPMVGMAVEAFRDVERVDLLLAKKQAILSHWVQQMALDSSVTPADRNAYVELTQEIYRDYDDRKGKVKVGPHG